MDIHKMLDLYVGDVVGQLPRSQRADVALELRALLAEELEAKSRQLDRPADESMTVDLLRDFGAPKIVAARYHDAWTVIAPTDTRSFVTAAILGLAVILGLAASIGQPSPSGWPQVASLGWLGCLVCYFGIKSWIERRWPRSRRWVPKDRERMHRLAGASLVALIAVAMVLYAAPAWVFAKLTGGVLSDWLSYDPSFHGQRLPWLLALWGLQAILLLTVTVRGRWNPLLRRIEWGLGLATAGVLVWFASGRVFTHSVPEGAAKAVLGLAIVLILVDLGNKLYRGLGGMPPRAGSSSPVSVAS